MKILTDKTFKSHYFGQKTPIDAKVSDHNLVIKGQSLFLNMMMQGRYNAEKCRYNNGFGLKESPMDYQSRIRDVVRLLAEALHLNPHINSIALAEAPVLLADINVFIGEVKRQESLRDFLDSLSVESFTSMGIATLFNTAQLSVTRIVRDFSEVRISLKDRVQEFEVKGKSAGAEKIRVFNLHLPYDLAKSKDNSPLIRFVKSLFEGQPSEQVIVMGDFNIHPVSLSEALPGVSYFVPKVSNILAKADASGKVFSVSEDTVDAIFSRLTVNAASRPYQDGSFFQSMTNRLFNEASFFSFRAVKNDKGCCHAEKPTLAMIAAV